MSRQTDNSGNLFPGRIIHIDTNENFIPWYIYRISPQLTETIRPQAGPEMMALITPLPSLLFPARVASKAITASSNLNLQKSARYEVLREGRHFTDE